MDGRIDIWISAIGVIKKNPLLGSGVGDSCDELKKEYKVRGFSGYYYENLNAHNQFLEVGINSGLIGLLIFITTIGLLAYQSISKANYILGLFLLSMIIFFMFESVLNRLTGVAFFSLFSFLLLHLEPSSNTRDSKNDK
jgi:O-antigen ligase